MASSVLCCLLLFITVWPADGFMEYVLDRCVFSSPELKDIEYIYSMYYDKKEYVRFNSSVGHFVGYTEYGINNAQRWNSGSEVVVRRAQKEICVSHVDAFYPAVLTKS
ncbi:H-2 class II histocompatibility antigen, I-E beta chain-like, partial [Nematolebias whitei]|uniref:H-2 class II histocompatibility antigen, I-E beta chain-like n=1 Tax=Nematolebias whitei TaxID=451745 RepID=UPI0018987D9E